MISYVKGIVEVKEDAFIVIEAAGIGYCIYMSQTSIDKLPEIGIEAKIYTYMSVKEDGISLYGFCSMEELNIFNRLITVSGVGPKAALGFLSTFSPTEIIMAIISEDIATLSKVPGVGKKTAQRVVLELKDKFKNQDFVSSLKVEKSDDVFVSTGAKAEAIEALCALGYSRSEAVKAVGQAYDESYSVEELLKQALKKMIN